MATHCLRGQSPMESVVCADVCFSWTRLGADRISSLGLLYDSLSELWLYIAYGILVFVAVQLLRADDILRFGKTMALFGSVYAVYAVFQGFTSEGRIYWLIKPRAGSVYGSYVNHNHY